MNLNPLSLAKTAVQFAPLALGPGGVAALAASQLTSRIGMQAIGQLGHMMGLPQASIDLAQGAFAASHGNFNAAANNISDAVKGFGDLFNVPRGDQDAATSKLEDAINKMVSKMADGEDTKGSKAGGKGGGGQSWLMALAEALGEKLDKMAIDMKDMAGKITDETPSLTAKFGAKSQEFGILMNAATNAIKTIGEAEANSARKG